MNTPLPAPRCWAVIPAAGSGQRMASQTRKQYLPIDDATVIEHALAPFLDHPCVAGVVVVLAAQDTQFVRLPCARHASVSTAIGGTERAQSVLSGLETLSARADGNDWVLVHDAARPCLARADLDRLIVALIDDDVGGLLAEPVGDTLKREDPVGERSAETLERSGIWRAQTPQMFRLQLLRDALKMAIGNGTVVTDEASAIEALGLKPRFVAGSSQNIKVTHAEDLELARAILARRGPGPGMKVGTGFDAHAFGDGDHVMLGGVRIAHARGVTAHSDGDVIIHALCDALLGAAGLGDIGQHFADSDPRWRGAASRIFLERVMQMLAERRLQVINADLTLLAEEPKLAPHRETIRRTLAELMHLRTDAVNLKATTLERMGFIGRGEGLAAQAIVLLAPAA